MRRVGAGYSTLEFDLETGQRGSRHQHLDAMLCDATGAQAGLATNNTAAGLTLALAAVAAGREVILSRGELVEIPGGFRVPDILRGSGALLREVGTTNRTRAADYAAAIPRTAPPPSCACTRRTSGWKASRNGRLSPISAAIARSLLGAARRGPGVGLARARPLRARRLPGRGPCRARTRARGARERPRRRRPRGVQRRQAARWSTGGIAGGARRPSHAHPTASPHACGARRQGHVRRAGGRRCGHSRAAGRRSLCR